MQENKQCQTCEKYEYCTMRKDKEICLEYSKEEKENGNKK